MLKWYHSGTGVACAREWNDSFTYRHGVYRIHFMTEKGQKATKKRRSSSLSDLPYLFTTANALEHGIPRATLHRLTQQGKVRAISRGLYLNGTEKTNDLDLAEIATKSPNATICLSSALVEHGLSDAIVRKIDIAIPRGTWAPKTAASVNWHRFDSKTFEQGRSNQSILGTNLTIGIYSPERTLSDLARHPQKDQAELVEGIRRWLRQSGNHSSKLLKFSQRLPGAQFHIQRILEILA